METAGVSLSWEQNNDHSVRPETEWTFIVTLRDLGNFIRYRDRTTR